MYSPCTIAFGGGWVYLESQILSHTWGILSRTETSSSLVSSLDDDDDNVDPEHSH